MSIEGAWRGCVGGFGGPSLPSSCTTNIIPAYDIRHLPLTYKKYNKVTHFKILCFRYGIDLSSLATSVAG